MLGRIYEKFGMALLTVRPSIDAAVVLKDTAVAVRGYVEAVRRLDQAAQVPLDRADEAFAALFEAANWLVSIAEQQWKLEKLAPTRTPWADDDTEALTFARNRMHHHWASVAEYDKTKSENWTWRTAARLPEPDDRFKKNDARLKPYYEKHLEGRPVIDVFRRLESRVTALAPAPTS